MKHILVSVLILVQATLGFAQYSEKIASGRPGQAIGAQNAGKGVFQLETGIDHKGSDNTETVWNQRAVLSATLLRYGILDKLEIHSGWEFRQDNWAQTDGGSTFASGVSFSSVGIRHTIFTGDGKKPSLAYQVSAKLNILSDFYNAKDINPHFMITSGMSLTDNLGITLNSGMDFVDGGSSSWNWIINFGYSLGDDLFAFAEMYGGVDLSTTAGPDQFNPYFDGGFGYFLNNNMQLDLLGGYALNGNISEYFVSLGFSWRLNHPEEMPSE